MNRCFAVALWLLAASAGSAAAQRSPSNPPNERWECKDFGDYGDSWKDILVRATVDGGVLGTLSVAGVTYDAYYHVEGFDRRWDFPVADPDKDKESFRYAFVVEPNGEARYYDFGVGAERKKSVKSTNLMKCRQTK